MDIWIGVSFLIKCSIIFINFLFIANLYLFKKKDVYYFLKTYAGYGIVIIYVTYAFPRMSWEFARLISETKAVQLWILSFISTLFPAFLYLFLSFQKTQRAWGVKTEKELKTERKINDKSLKQNRHIKNIIIENLNIIIQAFIIVILIQHFLFQLYVIPSESMVPTILTGDRPIVTKFQSGPVVPLTDWNLLTLKKPKRGDIVVFESPQYKQNSLFKKIFHHFVFLATLSLIDIDRDEQGAVRKRFIVKRIIGEPGDKLMMVDDEVYIKRKTDDSFTLLKEDKNFSHTDLYDESPEVKKQIQNTVITKQTRELFDRWDNKKNKVTIPELTTEIAKTVMIIEKLFTAQGISKKEQEVVFRKYQNETSIMASGMTGFHRDNMIDVFSKFFKNKNQSENTNFSDLNLYQLNGKKLNLIFSSLILARFLRYCEIMYKETMVTNITTDRRIFELTKELSEFYMYILYYDYRNFPEFPESKESFIPEGSYFLMGDNRYNSLDFRYSQERLFSRTLDSTDSLSFMYQSNLEPYLLNEKKILGIVAGRLWPLTRFGLIK